MVSVTLMAALFGGAGVGLAGYKMLKRTRGCEEFEFEQYEAKVGTPLSLVCCSLLIVKLDCPVQ